MEWGAASASVLGAALALDVASVSGVVWALGAVLGLASAWDEVWASVSAWELVSASGVAWEARRQSVS